MIMKERIYHEGDENEILDLFAICFGRRPSTEIWRWRYVENPSGPGIIHLMLERDRLVGHYAVVPMLLETGAHHVSAALSMTTMTHPSYRGRGIFPKLAEKVYESCRNLGIKAVYGFPNQNSYKGFTKKLGWNGFGNMFGWEAEIDKIDYSYNLKDSEYNEIIISEEGTFNKEFDEFWQKIKPIDKWMVSKNSAYLNWRYFQKPSSEYKILSFKHRGGCALGYMVLKEYRGNGDVTGHIVDMLFVQHPSIIEYGIKHAAKVFQSRGVSKISCWFTDVTIASVLSKIGFVGVGWPTYFGMKLLDETIPGELFCEDIGKWWLVMGDSDVF